MLRQPESSGWSWPRGNGPGAGPAAHRRVVRSAGHNAAVLAGPGGSGIYGTGRLIRRRWPGMSQSGPGLGCGDLPRGSRPWCGPGADRARSTRVQSTLMERAWLLSDHNIDGLSQLIAIKATGMRA